MTSAEVSKITGLSMQRVRQAALELGVQKISSIYWWSDEDLEALKARIGKRGRKKAEESE